MINLIKVILLISLAFVGGNYVKNNDVIPDAWEERAKELLGGGSETTQTSGGITSLGGLSGVTQTFSGMTALNDSVSVVSSGTDHKITLAQTATPIWNKISATSTTASSTITFGLDVTNGVGVGGTATTTILGNLASSTFSGGVSSIGLDSTNLRITNTAHFKDGLVSVVTGGSGGVPITGVVDSSVASQNALLIKNATNFAHSGTLAQFTLVNGSDSGAILGLTNAGTGNYITGDTAFIVKQGGSLGLGTSTFSSFLSVHGDALIAGSTTVKGLLATSTIETLSLKTTGTATNTFAGGIQFTGSGNICTAGGVCLGASGGGGISATGQASGTLPFADGANGVNWLLDGMELLKMNVNNAASSTACSFTNVPNRRQYRMVLYIPSVAASAIGQLRFNGDLGATYDTSYSQNNAAAEDNLSDTSITWSGGQTNKALKDIVEFNISNLAGAAKVVDIRGSRFVAGGTAPIKFEAAGSWNNTTNPIFGIVSQITQATTYAADTSCYLYGSRF